MFAAIIAMALMGLGLGYLLGVAALRLHVEVPELVSEVEEMLPGTNCGQCGYAGCAAGAEALAAGEAPPDLCPPGGAPLAEALAEKLNVPLTGAAGREPLVARVVEEQCIGCTRCFKVCPTDAIVGAPKQLHNVISEACTGCNKCTEVCPTLGIELCRPKATLANWRWPKPEPGHPAPKTDGPATEEVA